MNKPHYAVSERGTVTTFPKSTNGLESAIQFAKDNHASCVCCVDWDKDEVSIVWENK
jgi:hypothetical protein